MDNSIPLKLVKDLMRQAKKAEKKEKAVVFGACEHMAFAIAAHEGHFHLDLNGKQADADCYHSAEAIKESIDKLQVRHERAIKLDKHRRNSERNLRRRSRCNNLSV